MPHTALLLAEFIDRLSNGSEVNSLGVKPCTSATFSTHGTCVAGLVGARPALAQLQLPTGDIATLPLPYTGVDPMCEIVQISTNFDPDPETLLLAFLYTELIGADVVLMPRTIPDPSRIVPELGAKLGDEPSIQAAIAQIAPDQAQQEKWAELAQLIDAISMVRPVVCAAGNANEANAIYPANLAADHNGIISVGAVNAKGFRISYSQSIQVTVAAPSNDAEAFDHTEVRLDAASPTYDPIGVPKNNSNYKFSHFDIVSTDVPGPAGYSDGPFSQSDPNTAMREFGSYFCRFGGTSASSALTCGFISLAKSWLLANCALITHDAETFAMPSWTGTVVFLE